MCRGYAKLNASSSGPKNARVLRVHKPAGWCQGGVPASTMCCNTCGEQVPLTQFSNTTLNTAAEGDSHCKACTKLYTAALIEWQGQHQKTMPAFSRADLLIWHRASASVSTSGVAPFGLPRWALRPIPILESSLRLVPDNGVFLGLGYCLTICVST